MKKIALLLLAGASLLSTNVAAETNAPASKVTKIFDRELPNVPGKSMRAVLVEYGPGGAPTPARRSLRGCWPYSLSIRRSKSLSSPTNSNVALA